MDVVRLIIAENGALLRMTRVYLQDFNIKVSIKMNANFVSKLAFRGVYCAEGGKTWDGGWKTGRPGRESGF